PVRARPPCRRRDRACKRLFLGGDRPADGRRLPQCARRVKVSGIFVSTGPGEAAMVREPLPALHAQVDELVVVANGRGSLPGPLRVDTMLGAFLLMRRAIVEQIGGWDAGYKLYVEDIDLSYRAMKAGWERWWVPAAVVRHEYQAVIDKHFFTRRNLWHLRAMLRFLRKHPERLLALR